MPVVPELVDLVKPSKTKSVIACAVNTAVWIFGILFLEWNRYDVHVFLLVDLVLFVSFSSLRIVLSFDNDESLFSNLFPRIYLAAMVFVLAGYLSYTATVSSLPEDFNVLEHITQSPSRWTYGALFINYSGYFFHDFVLSGVFRKANPYVEAIVDFLSVVATIVIIMVFILFANTGKRSASYFHAYAIGFVVARFAWEVFIALRSRTFLKNEEPTT